MIAYEDDHGLDRRSSSLVKIRRGLVQYLVGLAKFADLALVALTWALRTQLCNVCGVQPSLAVTD